MYDVAGIMRNSLRLSLQRINGKVIGIVKYVLSRIVILCFLYASSYCKVRDLELPNM